MPFDTVYDVVFICPECGFRNDRKSHIPPKEFIAHLPDRIVCPKCHAQFERAELVAFQFVTVRPAMVAT